MRKLKVKRPSPAMIVALIALLVALGGTAYAAHKFSGKLIKKGSEPGNRLKNDSVTNNQVNESTLLGVKAGNVLAAEVPNGCTTSNANTGGVTAAAAGTECNVTFPRSITNCAIVLGTLLDFPGGGETSYRKLSGGTQVQVSRRDSAGGSNTAGAFSIAAICPS